MRTDSLDTPRRPFIVCTLAALLLCACAGCNYVVALGYLIGGPPQIQPAFERETRHSMTDEDVRVAVVCYAPDELKYQHDDIDSLLSERLATQLAHNKIRVVDPRQVRLWMEQNPDWDTPGEIGVAMDATYVIYVDMTEFSLFEIDSSALFRGRCDVIVSVFETEADGEGDRIFGREHSSVFPTHAPRSASEVSYESFRAEYFLRLSDELGRMFYPYLHGADVPYAT